MIYDCFMFSNEIEVLDIRLSVMNNLVDEFVLVESRYTHSGKEKELAFDNNKHLFKDYNIKHIVINDKPSSGSWEYENFQRNCISLGLKKAMPDDIIIVSDVDEIPNPKTIEDNIHLLDSVKIFSLKQKLFYFYVNMYCNSTWRGPSLSKFKNIRTPQKMRNKRYRNPISNGGWHYSYLGGSEKILKKIDSTAHTEFNSDEFKNIDHINKSMKYGSDIFKRGKSFKIVDLEGNGPDCISFFTKKYPYLLRNR